MQLVGGAPTDVSVINARKYHLTYAALGRGELSNEDVLSQLTVKRGVREYCIGNELHADPADPLLDEHKHVYVYFLERVRIRDWRYYTGFDLEGSDGRKLHPEIQQVKDTAGDRHRVIQYARKHGNYIEDLETNVKGGRREIPPWAKTLDAATTVRGGMKALADKHSDFYYLHGSRVLPMLQARVGTGDYRLYTLEDFTETIEGKPREDVMGCLTSEPIVIFGESNIAKTAFLEAYFKKPLVVSEMDDLKQISWDTDAIIFDDMDFTNLTAEATIRLLDMERSRSVKCRYNNGTLPQYMPRIFTTNSQLTEEDHIFPRGRNAKQQHAIDRRYRKIGPLTEPLQRLGRKLTPGELIVKKMVKGVLGRVTKGARGAKRPAAPPSQAAAPPPRKRRVIVDSDED